MKICEDCNIALEDEQAAIDAGLDPTICFKCGNLLIVK